MHLEDVADGDNRLLQGWEWIIIGVVAVVVIMWGPAKIPEFARALGRAKGEFEKASKEFSAVATSSAASTSAATPVLRSKDEILVETARSLGLSTEGKTKEQISAEVLEKVGAITRA